MQIYRTYADLYRRNLLEDVIPFWQRYSPDPDHGGYFTCLDRTGKVYDTDKFAWLQGRQAWTFAMLYNRYAQREDWLRTARAGIEFLNRCGRDPDGSYYFSLSREGQALTQAHNIFSDCFAAMAFHEYAKAGRCEASAAAALAAYRRFEARLDHPKGRFDKSTGHRPLSAFGLPMMMAYLTYELEPILPGAAVVDRYEACIDTIFQRHFDPDRGIIREFVAPDGTFSDTFDGRLVNPGHGIEAMWFLMDIACRLDRPDLVRQATDCCLSTLAYGWDAAHGGIFYFLDAHGAPPQQLEWDQKLWWVHLEALVALSRAYLLTRREDVWEWYRKVHDYTWARFPDPDGGGEWFGYLNRQGEPLLTLKGGKWKGCFHVPRALFECWRNFEAIADADEASFPGTNRSTP
ncbi:MAG: hypothetical protein RLY31_1221 [Bacteroidota bacterium]